MANWELWLTDDVGGRIALLDRVLRFRLSLVANDVGGWEVLLPDFFDADLFQLDYRVEFWRAGAGRALNRVFTGFFRRALAMENPRLGFDTLSFGGPGLNDLLMRRIIAYAAESAQASKSDFADDLLKELADENLAASATDANRDISAYFSVQPQTGEGPSVTKGFAWRNLLTTMQEVCSIAKANGTELWFSVGESGSDFEFRTHIGQIGADRSLESGNPLVFSRNWGNLQNVRVEADYSEEINYVYAGGQEEAEAREIVEVEDAQRVAQSTFNRREAFRDARNEQTTAGVTNRGNERLAQGRARLRFQGDLLDTNQARFQEKWNFGDAPVAEHRGVYYSGMVQMLDIVVDESGNEFINARLNVDLQI